MKIVDSYIVYFSFSVFFFVSPKTFFDFILDFLEMGNLNDTEAKPVKNDSNQAMIKELKYFEEKQKVLRELDLFVLDNSLRESTVGQLRGHTLESKWEIFDQVIYYYVIMLGLLEKSIS